MYTEIEKLFSSKEKISLIQDVNRKDISEEFNVNSLEYHKKIASLLQNNTVVKELVIVGCYGYGELAPKGKLFILLDAIQTSSIEKLHIQASGVGRNTEQVKKLCDFIKKNTTIKKLGLSVSLYTDYEFKLLCDAFVENRCLEQVIIHYCYSISYVGAKNIINMYNNYLDFPIIDIESKKFKADDLDYYSFFNKIKEANKNTKTIKKKLPQLNEIVNYKSNLIYDFSFVPAKIKISEKKNKLDNIKDIRFKFR